MNAKLSFLVNSRMSLETCEGENLMNDAFIYNPLSK